MRKLPRIAPSLTCFVVVHGRGKMVQGSWTGDASELNPPSGPEGRFLYGLNVVRTKHDKNVRRGAVVKAMAVFSRYHFLDVRGRCAGRVCMRDEFSQLISWVNCEQIFRAPLIMSLDKYYDNPSVSVLEDLYNALNSVSLASLPRPTWYERALMTRGVTLDAVGSIAEAHQPNVRALHFFQLRLVLAVQQT
jgi:hypothetical protein